MIINRAAVQRQTSVMALLLIIVIAGVYCYLTLPREAAPDITIPYVFVTTTYEGVSPEDVETLITIPIERKLKGLSDTEEITSISAEGFSRVAVKFLPKVDIDDALQKVRDKVDQTRQDLPDDLPNDPNVKEFNISEQPVIRVVLSGPFSLKRLKTLAEEFEDRMESVSGVLDVELSGGLEREIHVEFDLDRVQAYNMPFSQLVSSVTQSNVNMPGGSIDIGEGKYLVRVPEEFKHPSEIFSIVAFVRDGRPVYLRDVATIKDSYKDPTTRSRINRQPSVTLSVIKRSGENIIEVCDGVKDVARELQEEMPPNLIVDFVSDQSRFVRIMVSDLENNILSGLILVLLVILLFIGGRSALFVALAIPYSMFITFMLLTSMDVTMNMVVLFALILALGMLVDNGIVIVENIYRHMQQGRSRLEAAKVGVDEVAWPVITSTLTTVGAFAPLLLWPGIMGEFMGYMPLTVILALSGSLFVALVINPVLSAKFQTVKKGEAPPAGELVLPKRMSLMKRVYFWLLRVSLNHRLIVLLLAVVLLAASIMSFATFGRGVEFFPETDPDWAEVTIKAPVGTNLDASDALVQDVEMIVSDYPDIRNVISNIGTEGGQGESGTHVSKISLDFQDFHDRQRPSPEVIAEIRSRLTKAIKGAEVTVEKSEEGPPSGPPINLEISGDDVRELGRIADEIVKDIRDMPGLVDVKSDFVRGKPEIKVEIDKEKAALLGLDTFTIAYTIKGAINGIKVGVYREDKDEYDIVTRVQDRDRHSIEGLKRLTISGPTGEPIPVTSVATFKVDSGIGSISRKNQKRVVTVSGENSGRLANDIIKEIDAKLQKNDFPRGYAYQFTGEQEDQAEAQDFLSKAFVATIFIILVVLMTQFDSLVYPLIVLTSVLLSLIGVFFGLVISQKPFGIIMTGLGVISLAGVVVNNAIVLIDYYMQLLREGLESKKALLLAGLTRFRPVLLTAITTILGLMPMALGVSFDFRKLELSIGGGATQFWTPLAVAVIFGLLVATLLTLVVVPVLCSTAYSLFGPPSGISDLRKKRKKKA